VTRPSHISASKTNHTPSVHDKMPAEAAPSASHRGDFEAMAKRRFQDPKPERVGKCWYLRIRQDGFRGSVRTRTLKRIKLAPASIPEREVRKIAAEMLRPVNQGLITVGSAVNFSTYVNATYIPTELPLLKRPRRTRIKAQSRSTLSRDSTPSHATYSATVLFQGSQARE